MNILGGILILKGIFMRKVILIMLFLSVVVNAKQFAMCRSATSLKAKFTYCYKMTSTGKQIDLKARSAGEMYGKGWRLITVANYVIGEHPQQVYRFFYFEK